MKSNLSKKQKSTPPQLQPQQPAGLQVPAAPPAKKENPLSSVFKRFNPAPKPAGTVIPKLEIPEELKRKPGSASPILQGAVGPGGKVILGKKDNPIDAYLEKVILKNHALELSLRQVGVETEFHEFVRRMFIAAMLLSLVLAVTLYLLFSSAGLPLTETLLFAVVIGVSVYNGAFRMFLNYPLRKQKETSKNVERDILFAARDMIISLRSGMPLFNAITSVSKGYGDASGEFEKIVDKVQLGMPLEEAIDDTVSQSKSQSFRRIMLQASVSIKAGADVVGALQSIIDQLSQERIIELRSYGQKLNAIAMFYMLFGVILPSMGIAVITILTTFIAIFTVNTAVLEFVLIGIVFLQLMFLKLITGSRPVFSM